MPGHKVRDFKPLTATYLEDWVPADNFYRLRQANVPFVSILCHEMDTQQKVHIIMLLIGLLVLIALALSFGWLISGRKNMFFRNMGLITLGLSLILFFTTN